MALIFLNKISIKKQYLFAVSAITGVAAICFLFSAYITPEVVAFVLLVALSVIAMFFDILPVLLSAVLSALLWDFFFLHPRFNLQVGTVEDRIMLSMYFIIAMLNAVLTFKIRQIEKAARRKEEKIQILKLYDTLLNSLSHEFRTPLAAIIGATDNLLAKSYELSDEDRQSLFSEISIASLRLNQQVENLLNMSRLESGFLQLKKDWCNLNELAGDVLLRIRDQLRDHIVRNNVEESLPLFRLDYGLMEQVLYNLVHNGIRHTPKNSVITIDAKCDGDLLLITIEDNGNGFPEHEISKVFEKFYYPENSATAGSGLGLSIVKGFVEAHNGSIKLINTEKGGARFTIALPVEKFYFSQTDYNYAANFIN
ncbi:MAG: PAS domain-containing sensor histidine kinase [Bacteroidetes bacterium]|nr:PAS domain-containing sensor histidine kinase [Bacteroidota bacterium]